MDKGTSFWQQPILRDYLLPRLKGTFLVRLVAQVFGFGTSLLLTHWLGAAGYGVFAFAFAIITLLALPASLGLRSLLTREVAQLTEQKNWSVLKGLLHYAWSSTLLTSAIIMAIVFGLTQLVPWPMDNDLRSGLQWALWSLPLFAMVPVWQGTLTGLHQTHRAQIPEAIIRPALFLLVLLAVHWVTGAIPIQQVILLNVAAMGVAFVSSIILVRKYRPKALALAKPNFQSGLWLRSGLFFLLISSMHILNSHTDMLMIGTLMDAKATGIYQIPVRLGSLLLFPFIVFEMVVAPLIAKSYANRTLPDLQTTLQRLVSFVFGLILFAGIVLAFLRNTVLGWFGPEFPEGNIVLLIFIGIVLIQVMFGPVGYLMTMTGRERISTRVMALSAVLNIVLNLLLIPRFGIEGAAVATLSSELLWKGLLYIQVRKQLHFRPGILPF